MKVTSAIELWLKLGAENQIEEINGNKDLFVHFAKCFGAKNIQRVSSVDIASFSKKHFRRQRKFLRSEVRNWDQRYVKRHTSKNERLLPWEVQEPTKDLVGLVKKIGTSGMRVLELGCGDGMHSVFLASQGYDVTAVDISPTALEVAKIRAKKAGVRCKFVNANILNLKLKRKSFDFIYDKGCFHHIAVPFFEAYKEIVQNHLTDLGTYYLVCHSPKIFVEKAQDLYLGLFSRFLKYVCGGPSESGFSKSEIREIFSDQFNICEMRIIKDEIPWRPYEFVATRMEKKKLVIRARLERATYGLEDRSHEICK